MSEQDKFHIYWRNDFAFRTQNVSIFLLVIALIIVFITKYNSVSWLGTAIIFAVLGILGIVISEVSEQLHHSFEYDIQIDENAIRIYLDAGFPLILRDEILCEIQKKYLRVKDQYGVEYKKLLYNKKTIVVLKKYGVKFVKEIPDWY